MQWRKLTEEKWNSHFSGLTKKSIFREPLKNQVDVLFMGLEGGRKIKWPEKHRGDIRESKWHMGQRSVLRRGIGRIETMRVAVYVPVGDGSSLPIYDGIMELTPGETENNEGRGEGKTKS